MSVISEQAGPTERNDQASRSSPEIDPTEAVEELLPSLRTHQEGLSSREAQRRLTQYGANQLESRGGTNWPRELARQVTHPLALLLWAAALLSFIVGSITVGVAVVLAPTAALTSGMPARSCRRWS